MSRTLLRIFVVLVLAGAALTVRTDAIKIGDVQEYFAGGDARDRAAVTVAPTEGIPEPAMLFAFGLALSAAAWRIRRPPPIPDTTLTPCPPQAARDRS